MRESPKKEEEGERRVVFWYGAPAAAAIYLQIFSVGSAFAPFLSENRERRTKSMRVKRNSFEQREFVRLEHIQLLTYEGLHKQIDLRSKVTDF